MCLRDHFLVTFNMIKVHYKNSVRHMYAFFPAKIILAVVMV